MNVRSLMLALLATIATIPTTACTCKPPKDIIEGLLALFPYIKDGTRSTDQYALVKVTIGKPTPDGKGIFLTRLDTYFGRATRPVITAISGNQAGCGIDFNFYSPKNENDTFIFFLHRAPRPLSEPGDAEFFTGSICHTVMRVRNDSAWSNLYPNAFTHNGFPLRRLEDSLRSVVRALGVPTEKAAANPRIWPNPATPGMQVNIRTAVSGMCQLSIYDLQGRRCAMVEWMTNGTGESSIRLPQLSSGIYSAELVQNGQRHRELLTISGD